jgi:hypothetical protein
VPSAVATGHCQLLTCLWATGDPTACGAPRGWTLTLSHCAAPQIEAHEKAQKYKEGRVREALYSRFMCSLTDLEPRIPAQYILEKCSIVDQDGEELSDNDDG